MIDWLAHHSSMVRLHCFTTWLVRKSLWVSIFYCIHVYHHDNIEEFPTEIIAFASSHYNFFYRWDREYFFFEEILLGIFLSHYHDNQMWYSFHIIIVPVKCKRLNNYSGISVELPFQQKCNIISQTYPIHINFSYEKKFKLPGFPGK